MHFVPEAGQGASSQKKNPNCCWKTRIGSENVSAGFLRIDQPESRELDESFFSACEIADNLAQLANQNYATSQSLNRRTQDVDQLMHLGNELSKISKEGCPIELLLESAINLTGFRAAGYYKWNSEENHFQLEQKIQNELDSLPEVILENTNSPKTILIRRCSPNQPDWFPQNAETGLGVLISEAGKVTGAIWVFDRRKKSINTSLERERDAMVTISNQLVASLERKQERADFDVSAVNQKRVEEEFKHASISQPAEHIEFLDAYNCFEASGYCLSRYELGGDLCEMIPISKRYTLLAVGDAVGNSVPAAMIMSFVRGTIRVLAQSEDEQTLSPKLALAKINAALSEITSAFQFMSLIYAIIDSENGSITYGNAGHPLPIKIKYGQTETLVSHGVLLGLLGTAEYDESTISLKKNESIVFFSDGISEAMNRDRNMYSTKGIQNACENITNLPAGKILKVIEEDVAAHTGQSRPDDDQSLLVIKRIG